jgi:hypothetical protein
LNLDANERPVYKKNDHLDKHFQNSKIERIHKLLKELGWGINHNTITELENKPIEFKKIIESTINEKQFKILFQHDRNIRTKNHISQLNAILEDYGVSMKTSRVSIRKDGKVTKDIILKLEKLDIIDKFLIRRTARHELIKKKKDEYKDICMFDL